jgi:catechol 2,3-dioxygenase-like lactoylglutathione lyase family enzyme
MDEGMGLDVLRESARIRRRPLQKQSDGNAPDRRRCLHIRKGLTPEGVSYRRIVAGVILAGMICLQGAVAKEEPRPKISGVAFVRIGVGDVPTATGFYHGTLRLPKGNCPGESAECFFLSPSQQVELVKMETVRNGNRIDTIGMYTSDANALRQYLLAHGQRPEEITGDSPVQISFRIKDPEGHVIQFIQWTHGMVGSVSGTQPLSNRMIHVGFVVKDRAAADHFYRNILGFRLYWSGGMKEGETNWVAMQVPDGTDWVEYMLNVPDNADKHTLGVMNHISLGVVSVKAAKEQLEKAGVALGAEEQPKIGRDGKWQLNLYDPDGTRVELMEFTPLEKPCCSEFTGPHPKP